MISVLGFDRSSMISKCKPSVRFLMYCPIVCFVRLQVCLCCSFISQFGRFYSSSLPLLLLLLHLLPLPPYTRQIQPQSPWSPSSRPLYPTDSAPESMEFLQSSPIPD